MFSRAKSSCLELMSVASGLAAVLFAPVARADDNGVLSGAFGVATENVGRGISYSDEQPAAFGRLSWRKGAAEIASSAITVAGSADVEVAVAARLVGGIGDCELKAGVERTAYPGAEPNIDYWEFGLTVRRAWADGALDLGLRESPDDSGGAQYVFLELTQTIARVGSGTWSVRARIGWRPYDDEAQADYHHWSSGLEYSRGDLLYELTYHDTDLPTGGFFPSDQRVAARISYRFSQTLN